MAVSLVGCTTPRGLPPNKATDKPSGFYRWSGGQQDEVRAAQRMIEQGEASSAVPRLLHAISKSQDTAAATEAQYWLGVAYYEINSYRDAAEAFHEYLESLPEGPRAADSHGYLERIEKEYAERFDTIDELNAEIATVAGQLRNTPGDFDLRWQMADLLWRRGDYQEAGRIYAELVTQNPAYNENPTVASRIEWLNGSNYIVLSPAEVQRRRDAEQPLVIMNTHDFRAGEDLFTRKPRFYVVTGQVMNRSESVLYGAQVFVTIYGFGNVVYDTTTVHIGQLNPGEKRAFSVRFGNFENIENIHRYEVEGTFQR